MKKFLLAATLAATTALTAVDADAAVYNTGTYGSWLTYAGTDNVGVRICGMSVSGNQDRMISFKFYASTSTLQVQITKASWNLSPNQTMPVILSVDGHVVYSPMAFTDGQGNNPHTISFNIPLQDVKPFFDWFRGGNVMGISFPNGSEPGWTVYLNGSASATITTAQCIYSLGGAVPAPVTQPTVPTTQPNT